MATKLVAVPGVGEVTLYKRRGTRNIRLSVTPSGQVRVTLPVWAPYRAAVDFVIQKAAWINSQQQPKTLLESGATIGKEHRLVFKSTASNKISSRTKEQVITVSIPDTHDFADEAVQTVAQKACLRALRQEAEEHLPGRVRNLAAQHDFQPRSIQVKRLKSRWGSCNHRKEIVLNCFLMQLPWELIDYVILHELMHTKILAHGPKFWQELEKFVPNLKQIRREMREHRPELKIIVNTSDMA